MDFRCSYWVMAFCICFVLLLSSGRCDTTPDAVHTNITSDLPHPECSIIYNGQFSCPKSAFSGAGLTIPAAFDVHRIPTNTTSLRLGAGFSRSPLNLLAGNASPLPATLTLLTEVKLERFHGDHNLSAPVTAFLAEVKTTIELLYIQYSKIGPLDGTFLRGYGRLRVLDLSYSDVTHLHPDAFDTRLGDAPPAPVEWIILLGNELESLDWGVFAPIAANLTVINVGSQRRPLTSFTHTRNFTFGRNFFSLQFDGNVTFPPRSVLDTLSMTRQSTVTFGNDFLCPNITPDCTCCAAFGMVGWAYEMALRAEDVKPWLRFSCGTVPFGQEWSVGGPGGPRPSRLPRLSYYEACVNPDAPATSEVPSTTPATSGGPWTTPETPETCPQPEVITVTCARGNVTFSHVDFDASDALQATVSVDNTLKCRHVLRDMHAWILRQPHQMQPTASPSVLEVRCAAGQSVLDVSNTEPEFSEAVTLVYTTGVNMVCRSVFVKFLKTFHKQLAT
ncbi:uncharacterized protein LOC129602058 [Paramacrobiotus metropolitanus]|uniref:uncharacterized protein LOC129602058 n=1 Tax=Paramacrobiotus metropolitanus TaxID=2943436 RepID=UPI002445D78B|nr:uncharacterized protein LOC129602058 [Paramacrobiotus metropolitanus]